MSNGPASAAPSAEAVPSMLSLLLRLSEGHAALQERVSTLERSVPELAARLDGRFASLEAQVARTQDHLAKQDQAHDAFRLDMKSTLGTLASGLGTLQQAEQQRAAAAQQVAERAADAQARARDQAESDRVETRRWALQTVASVGLMLPGLVWPLIVTRPLALRLGVPAACITLVLALAAWAWVRSRR